MTQYKDMQLSDGSFVDFTEECLSQWTPSIEVIAHALSQINRFHGQTHYAISVAQHSIFVSRLCPQYPREGLLHDASEAILGDVSTGLKRRLPEYQRLEHALSERIARYYGLVYPWPEEIKRADTIALATERHYAMAAPAYWDPWQVLAKVAPILSYDARVKQWHPWERRAASEVERGFLTEANSLGLLQGAEEA